MNVVDAKLSDIPWITEIALEQAKRHPRFRPDKDKVRTLIVDCISSPTHYAGVIPKMSVLLMYVVPHIWAEKRVGNILLWAGRGGCEILENCLLWTEQRRGIKCIGMSPDLPDWSPGVDRLAKRFGFEQSGGSLIWYNGGHGYGSLFKDQEKGQERSWESRESIQ